MEKKLIDLLKARIRQTFGREVKTPKDFEALSESVHRLTGIVMSPTTFKRLWGYINEPVTPRTFTLDTLSRYVGYNGWEEFCQGESPEVESGFVAIDIIDVTKHLKRGDKIRLTWQPGRVCDVEYLGDSTFIIISTEGTKLTPGSTFTCNLIVGGEPLYLDNLSIPGRRPAKYVCGRLHGIHFHIL